MTCCTSGVVADFAMRNAANLHDELLSELVANSRKLENGNTSVLVSTPAIHCGNCIATIEREVGKISGVKSVRANLTLKRVAVIFDGEPSVIRQTVDTLFNLGFAPQTLATEGLQISDPVLTSLVRALAIAGFAAANIMLLSIPVWNGANGATKELFHFVSALIAIPSIAIGGQPFFRSAYQALAHGRMNMDVPISLGVVLATTMSLYESFIGGGHAYFDAATSLLFFLLIGRTLDHMMRSKARAAADGLVRLAAKGGVVVGTAGELTYVALNGLRPGMRIRVAVGERFPVDGTVVEGQSDIDRSLVTGESAAIPITSGTEVEAGTLNLTGPVDIVARHEAQKSFLAEVTQMMAAAEQGRSRYVQIADRMAKIYAPAVHVLAFATFAFWILWSKGDWHQSITTAIAVLIITCPCALGLAVPVAHVVAAGRLFRAGILMKDGSALERLATIQECAFDKTGTLTTGRPLVLSSNIPAGPARGIAKTLAERSTHPASRAIAKYLQNTPAVLLQDIVEISGCGVEASFEQRKVRLGWVDWVSEISQPLSNNSGHDGVAFADEGCAMHLTRLSETLRDDGHWVFDFMLKQGIPCHIISGDQEPAVSRLARYLNATSFAFGMRPAEKLKYLTQAAVENRKILMVGDGLNDGPALVAAHVSMAPATASDVGRTAADFVFMKESLAPVVFAYDMAKATSRVVRQNFGLAILYNIFAVPLAMAGQLNPLMAAIAMSTSSIIVVGNSLRLHLVKPSAPSISSSEAKDILMTLRETQA